MEEHVNKSISMLCLLRQNRVYNQQLSDEFRIKMTDYEIRFLNLPGSFIRCAMFDDLLKCTHTINTMESKSMITDDLIISTHDELTIT